MVENLDQVRELLQFDPSGDDFYMLSVIQRRKENPDMETGARVRKEYFINSFEQLDRDWSDIKDVCMQYNARAYLRLNKRSYRQVALETMSLVAMYIKDGHYSAVKNAYMHAAGRHAKTSDYWVIDVDDVETTMPRIRRYVLESETMTKNRALRIVTELPTLNGVHLIVKPFNMSTFVEWFTEDAEVKKEGNGLVFYHRSDE